MPPRKLPFKINKFQLGSAFILSVLSYNLADRLTLWITGYDLWNWIKLNGLQDQPDFILVLVWIGLLILPLLLWYNITGLYIKGKTN